VLKVVLQRARTDSRPGARAEVNGWGMAVGQAALTATYDELIAARKPLPWEGPADARASPLAQARGEPASSTGGRGRGQRADLVDEALRIEPGAAGVGIRRRQEDDSRPRASGEAHHISGSGHRRKHDRHVGTRGGDLDHPAARPNRTAVGESSLGEDAHRLAALQGEDGLADGLLAAAPALDRDLSQAVEHETQDPAVPQPGHRQEPDFPQGMASGRDRQRVDHAVVIGDDEDGPASRQQLTAMDLQPRPPPQRASGMDHEVEEGHRRAG
jgi:hypothetical protein